MIRGEGKLSSSLIELQSISKSYKEKVVLNDLSLTVKFGDFISIVGKSGVGKSTLLNIIALFESYDNGSYFLNGVKQKNFLFNSKIRNKNIGFIFQSYNLIPNRTVRDNILMPLMFYKGKIDKKKKTEWYDYLIKLLEISDLESNNVSFLSGGEKQRVAIARALIVEPLLVIADEPTGNLDKHNTKKVMNMLLEINSMGYTIVLVTHDEGNASIAREKYQLLNGRLEQYE